MQQSLVRTPQGSEIAIYREGSSGPRVFVVGGLGGRSIAASPMAAMLDAAARHGAQCTAMDISGTGASKYRGNLSMDLWLRDLAHVYGQTGGGKSIWVGSSIGAWLMLLVHRDHPEKFGAMWLPTSAGHVYGVFTADASIPYRTGFVVGERYDARLVAQAIALDIELNGAPLVYRFDRARAHDAPVVRDLLAAKQILALHGPPHCARFYGQHERQNREHRAWLADDLEALGREEIEPYLQRMIEALNGTWRRRSLGWKTAQEVWQSRPNLSIERELLTREVNERAAQLERHLQLRGKPADLAWRLAIEQALESRGLLLQSTGGWC